MTEQQKITIQHHFGSKHLICARNVLGLMLGMLLLFAFSACSSDVADTTTTDPWQMTLETPSGDVQLADLRDRTTVLSFFFTGCNTACPLQTAKLASLQDSLPTNIKDQLRFVSVSIDLLSDTPETISEFTEKFDIDTTHWVFGVPKSHDELQRLRDEIKLEVRPKDENGQIDHNMVVYLVRKDGQVIQRYVGHTFQETHLLQDLINLTLT